jgi:hypothetical protein
MIIHVSGASGAGKSTLGKKVKAKLKSKVVVKDMDDLRNEYFKFCSDSQMSPAKFAKHFAKGYQKFVDEFAARAGSKPILFVGLNCFIQGEKYWWHYKGIRSEGTYPKMVVDLHQDHSFYIDLDTDTIIKQQYYRGYDYFVNRFCQYMKRDKDVIFASIIENEAKAKKDICEYITDIMEFSRTRRKTAKWNKFYSKSGYEFATREDIYKKVIKLIQ